MRPPRLYLGTMTFGWSQTSSKVDDAIAGQMVKLFVHFTRDETKKPHPKFHIDTARIYAGGETENMVGEVLLALAHDSDDDEDHKKNYNNNDNDNRFSISSDMFAVGTKAHPSQRDGLSTQGIREQFDDSVNALSLPTFDEYYLHQPDPEHPLLESLECLHMFRENGLIRAVGMSNYHASEMERAFELAKKHNLTPPTVYQGLYNPLNRAVEAELLPVLRKHNCSFIAYNPLAAGLLAGKYDTSSGSAKNTANVPKGRFQNNPNYLPRFYTDANFQAVELIRKACDAAGISMVDATYRWLLCHSALTENDGVLLGASSIEQLAENVVACQMAVDEEKDECVPLPDSVLQAFDEAWKVTQAAGVFPYWRSYSSDMPNRESLDQGASYDATKKKE